MSEYLGPLNASDLGSDSGAMSFFVRQIMGGANHATLVRVVSVTNAGAVASPGYVDIQPLVHQVDGFGNIVPHGVIHHVPYVRVQGGANAVILDPVAGDVGVALFADRDISTVKATGAAAAPASRRRNDWADGVYLGLLLNGAPSQYVQFTVSGITVLSPTEVTITAPNIVLNGQTLINGALSQGTGSAGGGATMLGPVTVTHDVTAEGKSLATHVHTDPQGGDTGPPV